MQMKYRSNDFLSIHIPSYLLLFLYVVFHFFFFFCSVLLSVALFLLILYILFSCQAWEDRICDRSKRRGDRRLALTQPLTYKPVNTLSLHSPSCLKGSFTFPFYSMVSNESQYWFHSSVSSSDKYSFIYLYFRRCGYVLFISFSPCGGQFSNFSLPFSLLLLLPLILDFIFWLWCEGLLAQASVNSCQRRVAALS